MCEMLVKFYEASQGILDTKELAFTDNDKISDKETVGKAVSAGFIMGREDGSFDPEGSTTRAEAAAVIARYLGV